MAQTILEVIIGVICGILIAHFLICPLIDSWFDKRG